MCRKKACDAGQYGSDLRSVSGVCQSWEATERRCKAQQEMHRAAAPRGLFRSAGFSDAGFATKAEGERRPMISAVDGFMNASQGPESRGSDAARCSPSEALMCVVEFAHAVEAGKR